MARALRELRAALGLLTIVPMGDLRDDAAFRPASVAWFPFVGLLIGSVTLVVLAGLESVSSHIGGSFIAEAAMPLGALVLLFWAAITRLLHWDGLADVADALGGAPSHARRLEILKDTHVGAFGVAAVVLVALVQFASLVTMLEHASAVGWTLISVPVFGRLAAVFATWLGAPARPDGLGAAICGRPRVFGVVVCVVTVALAVSPAIALTGVSGVAAAIIGLSSALVVPHLISSGFGGVTGDVMGASVVVTETVCLVSSAFLVLI